MRGKSHFYKNFTLVLVCVFSCSIQAYSQVWANVGAPGFSSGNAYYTSTAVSRGNVPFIAYQDATNNYAVTVKSYNGVNWVNVGNTGFSHKDASSVSIAISSANRPYVAFIDDSSNKVSVMKYNGVNWANVGAPYFSDSALQVSFALGANDTAYIAYINGYDSTRISVMKFNGTSWVKLGRPPYISGSSDDVSLAIDPNNNDVYVAFSNLTGGGNANVAKYNSHSWSRVGGADFSAGEVEGLSLAISKTGTPMLEYQDAGNSYKATVMQFTGGNWSNLGNAGFSAGTANYTSLVIDSAGVPFVAYQDAVNFDALTVDEYTGSTWAALGSPGCTNGTADYTSMAVDRHGRLYVGYEDGAQAGSASVVIYQNCNTGNPTVTASVSGHDTICPGASPLLNASGATNYAWSTGDSTSSSQPVLNNANATYQFYVTGIAANGCASTDSVKVYTRVNPPVSITGHDTVCKGSASLLDAFGGNTYKWSTGSTATSINVSPANDSTFYVVGKNGVGCTDTAFVNMTVNQGPVMTIGGNDTICAGSIATIGASGANSYKWNIGSTTTSISVNPLVNTGYYVVGTSAAGCTDTSFVTVVVHNNPLIVLSGKDTVCLGDSTILSANGAVSYIWQPSNSTGSFVTISPSNTETITVTGTNSFGCSTTDSAIIVVNICAGIPGVAFSSQFNLAPNPATDNIYLTSYTKLNNANFSIYNVSGQLIKQGYIDNLSAGDRHIINVSSFSPGVYYVRVTAAQGTAVYKLVKQ